MASVLLLAAAGSAWAGRPLTVDDATDVADVGGGQVESWYSRPAGREKLWTTGLGMGVLNGVELGAAVERNFSGPETASAVQIKMRLTPLREGGCTFGAVLGRAHLHRENANTTFLNALASCDMAGGKLLFNVGANRADDGGTLKTWGLAKEFDFGTVIAHAEVFGQQHGKPTWQVGARRELVKNLQVDGTLGRSERKAVFSVGLKWGF